MDLEQLFYNSVNIEDEDDTTQYDTDSALGDLDGSNISESLASSIYDHRHENGRRYHAFNDGAYLSPDDEVEQTRLAVFHHLWKMILNDRLYVAPIPDDPKHILDVGTGTGVWAIEVADRFPSAQVIGTDLSPMQPTCVPPNCTFYIDDAATEWIFREKFDFIHARALCGTMADWPRFFKEVRRNLRPGGWVEMQDYRSGVESDSDGSIRGEWTTEWVKEINRASEMFGKSLNVAERHTRWLLQTGFVDVREQIIMIPIGPWAQDSKLKYMGAVNLVQMLESIESITLARYTRVLEYTIEQTRLVMEGVRNELLDPKNHWCIIFHFVIGRNPEHSDN